MSPKVSSNAKKNINPSNAAENNVKGHKFKCPTDFIVRPLPLHDSKFACTVLIHPDVMKEMGIVRGNTCNIYRQGENSIVCIAESSDDSCPVNIIQLSSALRSVGNLLLGDRIKLVKASSQPSYAETVTLGSAQAIEFTDSKKKLVTKILEHSGIIMPGMIFSNITENEEKFDLIITGIDEDINGEFPDVSSLNISKKMVVGDESFYLSPPGIFRKGSTKILFTTETEPHPKYNLSSQISYNFVGGLTKEIDLLRSSIELPLYQPTLFSDFGITPPRGILLHGPPGTGKTMLLKCVANETNAHILTINGPSIVSKYLGETESSLRDIFNEAKRFQPSIIFIDEIDSLAPSRSNDNSGEVESRIVATLLTLMDGMDTSSQLMVVGATNRPNAIDPALRRPGRFDQEIEIDIPDVDSRFDILKKQFNKMSSKRHELSFEDISNISLKTHGYVGADLVALCREAVMKTIQRGLKYKIDQDNLKVLVSDVEDAIADIRPSVMREVLLEMPKVYWSDIGGQEELKQKMKEMIQLPLQATKTFARLGVSVPRGILLYGPPGCSKTLMAKALATESGINFLAVKGPEVFNKYVGESEKTIREIFRKARAASPSIIFFDEIDALSSNRDLASSTSAANHVLTSLLNEIDGIEELNGVIIVAATNRPDEIDPALLRPGRLDRHVYVGPPDYEARLQILKKCTKNFNLNTNELNLNDLSEKTDGCSGAEVVLLCQEAGLAAIVEDLEANQVQLHHFEKALKAISKGITEDMLNYYNEFQSKTGIPT